MKRLISISAILLCLLIVLTTGILAAEPTSGTCGENLTWSLADGVLTISGTGEMYDFDYPYTNAPWYSSRDQIKKVVVSEGVETIGGYAFASMLNATQIELPEGLVSIGERALHNSGFAELVMPDSVEHIGEHALDAARKLEKLVLSEGLTTISQGAFNSCDALTYVEIPPQVKTLERSAFANSGLEEVKFNEGLETISYNAFSHCPLKRVEIPDTVTTMEGSCFSHTTLKEAIIPGSVKVIPSSAFFDSDLETVTLGEGIETIKFAAFDSCRYLRTVHLPETLKTIENSVFQECRALAAIDLPDGLESLGHYAFNYCVTLKEISIPSKIQAIQSYTFCDCWELERVSLPDGLTSIGICAFRETDISELIIPDTVTQVGQSAFVASGVERVILSKNMTQIPTAMFDNCRSLKWIVIHDKITAIEGGAFCYCLALEDVFYCGNEDKWNAITLGVNNECLTEANKHFNWDCSDDHVYTEQVIAPDCTNRGYTLYTCIHCEQSYCDYYVNALNHQWDAGIVLTLPTPNATGLVRYECLRCGLSKTEKLSYGTHHYGAPTTVVEPTCEHDGHKEFTCQVCGDTYTETIPATGHSYDEGTAFAPTCTNAGGTLYRCVNCSHSYTEETIAALGHTFDEGIVTREPTAMVRGEKLCTCSVCGYEKVFKIPALEPVVNPFNDVSESRFYYDPVFWALENNITKGVSSTSFAPEDDCTRGQVVTFLWRVAGCPAPTTTEHPFTDVREGAYYYKAMLWAVENGITAGTTPTTFAPDDPCTRGQVVTFLWRAAEKPTPTTTDHSFTDIRENGYYYKAMLWAVENGITAGITKTKFAPDDTCTRGQVVTFLFRYAG